MCFTEVRLRPNKCERVHGTNERGLTDSYDQKPRDEKGGVQRVFEITIQPQNN